MSAVLALILSLTMSPEAANAKQQPVLFGSGQSTFLLIGPAGPGDVLRLARVRVTHLELPEARSFDDAEYRFVPSSPIPPSTRPGQQISGTLWRFGAESPEGRKLTEGVRLEFEREDTVAPVMARGLAYRAMGTQDRLYLVHAGTKFVQILRVEPSTALLIPPDGVQVRVDRPSQEPATRLLPGEYAKVIVGEGKTMRVTALAEVWFVNR